MAEPETLCRRLRLKYIREEAPEGLLAAKAQRWDPTEMPSALLLAELEGAGDAPPPRTAAKRPGSRPGKTFDTWDQTRLSIPTGSHQALRSLEWIDRHETW